MPAGVRLPAKVVAPDVIATLIRTAEETSDYDRMLTQVKRILRVNQSDTMSKEIVTAARDHLVIGQS